MNFKTIARTLMLAVLLFGASGIEKAMASHYAAADMYADFIGRDSLNLKYRVTLIVYFSCKDAASMSTPINAVDNETINWSSALGVGGTRGVTAVIRDTVDQLCKNLSSQNACYTPGSIYPGFARRVYVDTITLSSAQPDWKFTWSNGSRYAGITNLDNPGSYNIYIECGLNNTGRFWSGSTPRFDESPVPYYCVNQNNTVSNAPFDPDNRDSDPTNDDSLITFNAQPRSAAATLIPYSLLPVPGTYTLGNPFGGTVGSYQMNTLNGSARFVPPVTGKFVIAYRVESYNLATGVRTGYTNRDVQVAVIACAASQPSIDTIPINFTGGTSGILPGNIISICPNQLTSFDMRASSTSNSNYLYLEALDNTVNAPGSNFTTDTSRGVTLGHFSWTPTTADIGTHLVTFRATDTTCDPSQPIKLNSKLVVIIRVRPGLDAGPDLKICPLGDAPVQLFVNGPANKVYKWFAGDGGPAQYISNPNIQNPTANPPVDYTYIVSSPDPDFTCKSRDTVNVIIDRTNDITVIQDPIVVCRPSYITIGADSVGPGPVKNVPCGPYNTFTCTTPDVITIGVAGNTGLNKLNTPFYSNYRYHKYQFIIPKSELHNAGLYSGTLSSISFLSNNALLGTAPLANVRVSLMCTNKTTFPTIATNSSFETGTTTVATVANYTITPNAWNKITFDQNYNWDTTQNLLVDICMGPLNPANTNGLDPVDMTVGATIQRFSNTVDVCSGNALDSAILRYNQRPIVRFDYCSAPTLPFDYHWTPGTNLADSTIKYTTAYIAESINYAVETRGRNGCLVRDSLHIIVPHYTLRVDPKDTAVCVFQPAPLHATGAQGYIWYENGFNTPTTLSCNDCADPIATPTQAGDIVYTVVFVNPDNCYDTLTQTIHVYDLPKVVIVNRDTTVKYGKSVQLYVNGANQYTWTPVGSLNDPNIPNPIATPTQTTSYVVFGIDQHQCRNSDTVKVKVDFRDNLLVPTGFTPNLDGRNDYFKVVNVTFQKLMEFRVFNRWGQEVFNTTDPQKGWDGKWKGVDQDMGTYKYIIRVAFPDGFVETYKGDVSLIR